MARRYARCWHSGVLRAGVAPLAVLHVVTNGPSPRERLLHVMGNGVRDLVDRDRVAVGRALRIAAA